MEQCQIVFGFLFQSRQDAAKAVHPAMGSLYNPAEGFEISLLLNGLYLLSHIPCVLLFGGFERLTGILFIVVFAIAPFTVLLS